MERFVSKRVVNTPPSGLRKYFDIAAEMRDVISLGIGEPDFVTPEPILKSGHRALRRGETHYTSNSGTFELRDAISRYLNRLYQIDYDPMTEVLVTVGVSEAMNLVMTALLDPGDEVIVPEPCFVAYQATIEFAGGVVKHVPSYVENGFAVTAAEIEAAITPKTKAIFIGYPCNPTGAVLTAAAMQEIADLAEKHDLIVISDEIYSRLIYNGTEHVCFAALPNMKDRTIILNGFSKSHAMTGWRVGYVCAHSDLLFAMRKVHQYIMMSAPTIAQFAAFTALEEADDYVEEMRQSYDKRRRLIVDGFNTLGLDCFEPKGAFYAFPSIARTGMTSDEFCMRFLYEYEVAMIPGNAFGPSGDGYARAAYATAYDKIEEALNRLESFMRQYG